jgi:glycosyltransferase involved in cell wall biosynthesis
MEHGSGTNLKMLDFLAAGIPVLTTPIGARGIGMADGVHAHVAEIVDFEKAIRRQLQATQEATDAMTRCARSLVESEFDWDVIAQRLKAEIDRRVG